MGLTAVLFSVLPQGSVPLQARIQLTFLLAAILTILSAHSFAVEKF
jgi:hypothetical protein